MKNLYLKLEQNYDKITNMVAKELNDITKPIKSEIYKIPLIEYGKYKNRTKDPGVGG